jgi:hypothetical protein
VVVFRSSRRPEKGIVGEGLRGKKRRAVYSPYVLERFLPFTVVGNADEGILLESVSPGTERKEGAMGEVCAYCEPPPTRLQPRAWLGWVEKAYF